MELIEFLRARLDEDQAKVAAMQRERTRVRTAPIFQSHPLGWLDGMDIFVSPDRWQAEVEAKRRIIAHHRLDTLGVHDFEGNLLSADFCTVCQIDFPCPTLRMLSLAYLGHPDFREEWRP